MAMRIHQPQAQVCHALVLQSMLSSTKAWHPSAGDSGLVRIRDVQLLPFFRLIARHQL